MWLKKQTFIFHSSGGWKSKIKVLADSVSDEALCLSSFSHVTERKASSPVSFYKSTSSIHEGFTLVTELSPKVPPPNTITLGIRFQHEVEGTQTSSHFHSISVTIFCGLQVVCIPPWIISCLNTGNVTY